MKKRRFFFALLIVLIILTSALAWAYNHFARTYTEASPPQQGELVSQTITSNQLTRSFLYYRPKSIETNSQSPIPLLFVLHGSMSEGSNMRLQTGYRFEHLAEEYGFILIYPNGFENHWNDCRGSADYTANTQNIDDPQFFRDMVDFFSQRFTVDPQQIFATGLSNGGHMTYRLALEVPDLIRAIAPVAANLPAPENNDCQLVQSNQVSVAVFNGTADPVNPYEGGLVSIMGNDSRGTVLSSHETAMFWRNTAGIDDIPPATTELDAHNDDGTHVTVYSWKGLQNEVRLYQIHNGGHTIPTPEVHNGTLMGLTSTEINGPMEIWNFFQSLPKRSSPAP